MSILLAALGSGAAYYVVFQLSARAPAVVMARDVPIGQELTFQDVTTVMVAVDTTVSTIPGRNASQVVGRIARTDLYRGQLLSSSALTDRTSPAVGEQLVPIALKPSRLPARPLRPGDQVVITQPGAKQAITATVDRVAPASDTDGLRVIDLLVSAAQGEALAALAVGDGTALILNPRRP